jgi:hypothetical protein
MQTRSRTRAPLPAILSHPASGCAVAAQEPKPAFGELVLRALKSSVKKNLDRESDIVPVLYSFGHLVACWQDGNRCTGRRRRVRAVADRGKGQGRTAERARRVRSSDDLKWSWIALGLPPYERRASPGEQFQKNWDFPWIRSIRPLKTVQKTPCVQKSPQIEPTGFSDISRSKSRRSIVREPSIF